MNPSLLYSSGTMATLQSISNKVVEIDAAMKSARTAWDTACRSKASPDTQENLWNYYISLQSILSHLDNLLKKASSATIELDKASTWRSHGIYSSEFIRVFKLTYPTYTDSQIKIMYGDTITKANEAVWAAQDKLRSVLKLADPYL